MSTVEQSKQKRKPANAARCFLRVIIIQTFRVSLFDLSCVPGALLDSWTELVALLSMSDSFFIHPQHHAAIVQIYPPTALQVQVDDHANARKQTFTVSVDQMTSSADLLVTALL